MLILYVDVPDWKFSQILIEFNISTVFWFLNSDENLTYDFFPSYIDYKLLNVSICVNSKYFLYNELIIDVIWVGTNNLKHFFEFCSPISHNILNRI